MWVILGVVLAAAPAQSQKTGVKKPVIRLSGRGADHRLLTTPTCDELRHQGAAESLLELPQGAKASCEGARAPAPQFATPIAAADQTPSQLESLLRSHYVDA